MTDLTVDIIGYAGSALLLISMMMRDMRTLRWINVLGCGTFIVYGCLLGAVPIIITNTAILLVNLFYLFLKKAKA
jgi:hypothetical protein|tara:strand:+ start:3407 stop:3631 length:225 start_codon:yes stop_codon:yes gene_type:complete